MDKNQKQLTHDEHLELELLRILVSDALESVKAQQIMEIIKYNFPNCIAHPSSYSTLFFFGRPLFFFGAF